MRRFDGEGETPSAARWQPGARRTWLAAHWGRPQLGAVIATVLVGLVAVPLWMSRDQHPELGSSAVTSLDIAPAAPDRAAAPAEPDAAPAASPGDHRLAAAPPAQSEQEGVALRHDKVEAASKAQSSLASDIATKSDEAIVTASRRAAPQAPAAIVLAEPVAAPAPPPAAAAMGRAATAPARERDDNVGEVVVTSRRAESDSNEKSAAQRQHPQARRTSKAGDWNACTVNDPTRSLGACAQPPSGHIADGLSRAWQGDLDGAIAEFDQAIAASQQPGLAYLNRGLAYERKGERDRALVDLDRAVRQAPNSARAYYNRSLALDRNGEKDRARADAERAMELDPRYAAVIQ